MIWRRMNEGGQDTTWYLTVVSRTMIHRLHASTGTLTIPENGQSSMIIEPSGGDATIFENVSLIRRDP